jgi:ABC-2 type transport system ATP-binding protein
VLFSVPNGFRAERLENVSGVTAVNRRNQHITVSGKGPLLANVATALAQYNIAPADLRVQQANLEDVFLAMTGRAIRN